MFIVKIKSYRTKLPLILLTLIFILSASAFLMKDKINQKTKVEQKDIAKPITSDYEGQINGRYLLNGTVTWARAVEQQANGNFNQPFSRLDTFNRNIYDAWSTDFECPITNNVVPYRVQIDNLIFNCRPEFLPEASKYFDIFDLANNHTYDQGGEKGLAETRANLDKLGLQYFGTYDSSDLDNICEVIALPVKLNISNKIEKASIPVAFCGWHYFYRQVQPVQLEVINKYSKIMPVFAFTEMGAEYQAMATPSQVQIAHQIMDYGPEFLIANNPHWVQNTEVYKNKLIVYSTGNFIFDQLDSETNRSASIDVSLSAEYDENVAKWIELAPTCLSYHDDCLARAEKQGLKKLNLKYKFDVIAGLNGYKVVTHKATSDVQEAVEQRMNWKQTLDALGQR